MLFVFLFFLVMSIVGYILQEVSTTYSETDIWGGILTTIGVIACIGMLLAMPLTHLSYHGDIAAFQQTKKTINKARKNNALENAALTQKIVESNQWLRRNKYWNDNALDMYIPDEIDTLTYIQ
jgi:UDP-N-acetylmuramoylalanine-D-glutamate ligase